MGSAAALLVALASGAWAQAPADSFDFRDASLPDTEARMRACVGLPKADMKRSIEVAGGFRGNGETRFTNGSAIIASQFGRWACVQRTASGLPVWPLEAFDNIATIEGVDAQDMRNWRLALLAQLRETGKALGLIKWPNGNGHEIEVEVQPGSALNAKWRSRHMAAGSYDEKAYAVVLAGTGLKSIRSVQIGNGEWHTVVPRRAVYWPVQDSWAVLPGTPQTTAERLTGTQWVRDDERLRLEADGRATATSKTTRSGSWHVQESGVLRIQWSDNAHDTLRLAAEGLQLTGIRRRTQVPIGNVPGEEFQAAVAYDLVRTAQAPTPAASSPVSAPAPSTAAVQHIGALLVFERELKALGLGADADAASLLQTPARALWTPSRAREMLTPPADLQPLEASAVLTLQKRLAGQLLPLRRTAIEGFKTDPERFAEVYLDLADLLMRLSAANIRVTQRLEASNKLGSDASGTRAATQLMMQTALQAMVSAHEARLPQLPARLRGPAEARLRQFREECADALQMEGNPPASSR